MQPPARDPLFVPWIPLHNRYWLTAIELGPKQS